MDAVQLFFIIATFIWGVGGLLAFSWLYSQRIKRFLKKSWKALKNFLPKAGLFIAMMGPFLVPIAVTALCLFLG